LQSVGAGTAAGGGGGVRAQEGPHAPPQPDTSRRTVRAVLGSLTRQSPERTERLAVLPVQQSSRPATGDCRSFLRGTDRRSRQRLRDTPVGAMLPNLSDRSQ